MSANIFSHGETLSDGNNTYTFLPFRFDQRDNGDYFLVNEVGEFYILPKQDFQQFINHVLTLPVIKI